MQDLKACKENALKAAQLFQIMEISTKFINNKDIFERV